MPDTPKALPPQSDKFLAPAYIKRAQELLAAVAVQLETEFGVKRQDNLMALGIIAKAMHRKDI